MDRKIIQQLVRENLIKEASDYDDILNDVRSSLSAAKDEFKAFIGDIMGSGSEAKKAAVVTSLKTTKTGRALMNDPAFAMRTQQVASHLGVQPMDLYKIFNKESGLNPREVNPYTRATGILQFMPSTARGLGTSVEELKNMPAIEQLDYVEKYFRPYRHKVRSYEDLYLATFFPAALGHSDESYIQYPMTGPNAGRRLSPQLISRQNPAIARAAGKRPGVPLTVADFKTYANSRG